MTTALAGLLLMCTAMSEGRVTIPVVRLGIADGSFPPERRAESGDLFIRIGGLLREPAGIRLDGDENEAGVAVRS
ncbi:hypothetical protein [Actinoalloteichus sp. GBA129-24]|uniref:hypothetical protein n=1 Tax=Actinoalloteichus sp. GBA129-24 TaxID=1612551 RepID=UPI00095089AA|nr:hypothetical protein [Actinoalloteichus sp. GBA129-24]APU22474.1 hypothetical protein UA75_22440 [Actinoalloteichus sp. GBA129-24]